MYHKITNACLNTGFIMKNYSISRRHDVHLFTAPYWVKHVLARSCCNVPLPRVTGHGVWWVILAPFQSVYLSQGSFSEMLAFPIIKMKSTVHVPLILGRVV